jgi:acetyltransferase-like isoleucine patch superfamily enzyme
LSRKVRLLILSAVALLPGWLKILIYKYGFGYQIGNRVRIGVSILDCQKLVIGDGTNIGHGTLFWRCGEVNLGESVVIGHLNLFRGGTLINIDDYGMVIRLNVFNAIINPHFRQEPKSHFHLGYGSVVTAEHRIDFTDEVSIGSRTILGGRNSSIWTHNRRNGSGVSIGDNCYIGSEIRMAPGSSIPSMSIVGIGSVVTAQLDQEGYLIAGVPARPVRPLTVEDKELITDPTRLDLPEIASIAHLD